MSDRTRGQFFRDTYTATCPECRSRRASLQHHPQLGAYLFCPNPGCDYAPGYHAPTAAAIDLAIAIQSASLYRSIWSGSGKIPPDEWIQGNHNR
jgi:hypothetical protein